LQEHPKRRVTYIDTPEKEEEQKNVIL